ncbi:hypothetical protein NMY22_g18303 [Coprinellus aureogranulatus]|nr:hypothetical protein NMY22_g18303 [Coprinellus aureogranulatus]
MPSRSWEPLQTLPSIRHIMALIPTPTTYDIASLNTVTALGPSGPPSTAGALNFKLDVITECPTELPAIQRLADHERESEFNFNEGVADQSPLPSGPEGHLVPPKRKRQRQALSCTECKRRKIKCDRDKYVTRTEYDQLKDKFDELWVIVHRLLPHQATTATLSERHGPYRPSGSNFAQAGLTSPLPPRILCPQKGDTPFIASIHSRSPFGNAPDGRV